MAEQKPGIGKQNMTVPRLAWSELKEPSRELDYWDDTLPSLIRK